MVFLGVAGRDDVGPMRDFVDRHQLTFPHVADVSGEVWAKLGVRGQPSWIFINDDGSEELVVGVLGRDGLKRRLEELVST